VRDLGAVLERVRPYRRLGIALGVATVLLVLFAPELIGHMRSSTDHFTFSDDVRVLTFAQFRLEDPELFPNNPAVDYFLTSLPEGYALLYRLLTPLFGVVALSKGLPYVTLATTLACLGVAAWRLAGGAAVFGALALALGSSYLLGRMTGGLPRAFAAPLLAAGTLALIEGRARVLAVVAVVAAGFYPAAALTLGVTLALLLLMPAATRGEARAWSLGRRISVVALTAVFAALVLLPAALRLRAWGSPIGPALIHDYPEAGPFGRFQPADRAPFPPLPAAALAPLRAALVGDGAPIVPWLDARAYAAWLAPCVAVLGVFGCAWLAWRRVDARRFLLLPLAVILCHTASLVLEPRLFLPERYVAYAVPVIVLVAVPATFGAVTSARVAVSASVAVTATHDAVRNVRRLFPWFYNALIVLVLGAHGVSWAGLTVHISRADRPLFHAIAQLPSNAVIAAFPTEASDSIPYLTRRSVFLARETHMPFHTRYTDLMRARARALIHAYFASDPAVLRHFRDTDGVTHLLVDRKQYRSRPDYFAPFDRQIARDFKAGQESGFAALKVEQQTAVFEAGDWALLDLRKL
jgi:hypothetical protein